MYFATFNPPFGSEKGMQAEPASPQGASVPLDVAGGRGHDLTVRIQRLVVNVVHLFIRALGIDGREGDAVGGGGLVAVIEAGQRGHAHAGHIQMQPALDGALRAVGTAGVDRPVRVQAALGGSGVGLDRRQRRAVHAAAIGHADGIANGNVSFKEGDCRRGRTAFADNRGKAAVGRRIRFREAIDAHGLRLRLIRNRDLEAGFHLKELALQRAHVAVLHLDRIRHRKHVEGKLGTGEGKFLCLVGFDEGQRVVALTAGDGLGIVGGAHVGGVDLIVGKHSAVAALKVNVRIVGDIAADLFNIACLCLLGHTCHAPFYSRF